MKIKTKILYSKAEKDGHRYDIWIYAIVDTKTGIGKKITFKNYENIIKTNKLDNWLKK